MAKTSLLKKEIDQTSFLYDRKEVVTAPLWPNSSSSLLTIYTSSNQPHHQKIYYRSVYSNIGRTGSMDVDFSVAYGHFMGSGSSTGSFGLIATSSASTAKFPVSESMAIYSQYRSMLYEYDKRQYLSDGKFRFYGLKDTNYGIYEWGFTTASVSNTPWRPTTVVTPLDSGEKVDIPGVLAFSLKEIQAISVRRRESTVTPGTRIYHFINKEGRLFQRTGAQISQFASPTYVTKEFGIGSQWKDVSIGEDHAICIKTDGTMWAWGDNVYGQLGLGYTYSLGNQGAINAYFENIDTKTPTQIGTANNWKKVYTGLNCSFAINEDNELYSWGWDDNSGVTGQGTIDQEYYTPTKIGNNTWNKIHVAMVSNDNAPYSRVFAIDTSGKLWGWGHNTYLKKLLSTANDNELSPVLLNSDTDWFDISSGNYHAIGLKGSRKLLTGWGWGGLNGEFLGSSIYANNSYTISNRVSIDSSIADNNSVSCGSSHTFLVTKERNLLCWGDNTYGQLFLDTSFGGSFPLQNYLNYINSPSQLQGWDIIASGIINTAGAINYPDENVFSMPTDDIYVINLNRWNFRDKVDAGSWQLGLRSVYTGSGQQILYQPSVGVEPTHRTITLIDESINLKGTEYSDPMYDVNSKGGVVYSIYSGSLTRGIHESAGNSPYGLFFPENGIIILNGDILRNEIGRPSITIQTRRTPATSSGAFPTSSNADLIFASISGAMQLGLPFIANTVETKIPTYCFVRINNDEFNHTLNPSFYENKDTFLVKEKFREIPQPFSYITTVGLYNDDDDLLAIAKLSRPILKTPSTELVIKVKLDI